MSDLSKKPPASHYPAYCAMYPELAEISRAHGYALAIHGSCHRDFDLVCVPWAETPATPEVVVAAFLKRYALRQVGEPEQKLHGRVAYLISLAWGECAIDLSFMPVCK